MSNHLPYFDGDFTKPSIVGPIITTTDPVTFAQLYTVTLWQLAANYRAASTNNTVSGGAALGSSTNACPGFLAEWTDPKALDGGVLEWTRTYSQIPGTRLEYESFTYSYQFYKVETNTLSELPITSISKVFYTYFKTADPSKIPLRRALRYMMFGSELRYVGVLYPPGTTEIYAEDETLRRWKGIIWEKKTRIIDIRDPRKFL